MKSAKSPKLKTIKTPCRHLHTTAIKSKARKATTAKSTSKYHQQHPLTLNNKYLPPAPLTTTTTTTITTSRRHFGAGGCGSSSCCGGRCGSGDADADDVEGAPKPTPAGKKTVCDPYGLDGKPLGMDQVELQLEFALENRWKFDTNQLSRTFSFSKTPLPPLVANVPGALSGPCHGQGAAFTFMAAVNNISTNTNHWPYHIEVVPRKPQVVVSLKTVGRAGITYADIGLASKMDAFFDANMTSKTTTGTNGV